jgi:hypothetical protein
VIAMTAVSDIAQDTNPELRRLLASHAATIDAADAHHCRLVDAGVEHLQTCCKAPMAYASPSTARPDRASRSSRAVDRPWPPLAGRFGHLSASP